MTRLDDPSRLPPAVARAAGVRIGAGFDVIALGGLSGRLVARLRGPGGSVVVKGPVRESERQVARGPLAEALASAGVRTARCLEIVEPRPGDPAGVWLVLEDVPHPLPRRRWGADPETVAMLRALHGLAPATLDALVDRYRPRWDEAMTERAARRLEWRPAHARRIEECRTRAQHLFRPERVVSADPNPLNWRVDAAGRLVLIDWERLTLASPAIDLAIVLPGLAGVAEAEAVRDLYGPDAPAVDEILAAKVWTVVELAASAAPGSAAERVVRDLRDPFLELAAAASS